MFSFPLQKYSPVSLGLMQPAFPLALELIAVFVSHEVLGLYSGAVWYKQHLSLGLRIILRMMRCSSWGAPYKDWDPGREQQGHLSCLTSLSV